MASPKSRISRSRRGMRRSHSALEVKETRKCPTTGEIHQPHKAFKASDGAIYYKGKQITHSKY